MGNTTIAESLIGVFVALTLVVTFRRKTHKAVELAVWIGLIGSCLVTVTAIRDPQTNALTTSAAWGIGQVVGTIAGAFKLDALNWTYRARFLIADWVLLLSGADALLLALVSTNRQAGARMPATKLREWWVLPGLPMPQPARAASAVDEINERFNRWSAPAAAATAMWSTLFLIWLRDVEIPIASRGLRNVTIPAVDVLWRAAGGWRRVSQRQASMSRIAHPTAAAPGTRATGARLANSGALRADVVQLTPHTARVEARKTVAGTAAVTTTKRIASPAVRQDTNGSKKHRPSRLAS